ncbi:ABC transporter substrate-binding protein, partial [Mycobacterium tuberculosis]|nr:ABC transporter substrate-binding protein [Mycobacterium tuberculosis]
AAGVPESDITTSLMAKNGPDLYGNALMVNPKFAADKPELVKAFARATIKGFKDAVADPAKAVDLVVAKNPVAKKEVELERLKMALADNIVTPYVEKEGFGGVD